MGIVDGLADAPVPAGQAPVGGHQDGSADGEDEEDAQDGPERDFFAFTHKCLIRRHRHWKCRCPTPYLPYSAIASPIPRPR